MRSSVTIPVKMCVMTVVLIMLCSADARGPEQTTGQQLILRPVGSVHKQNGRTTLVLNKEVEPALRGLGDWSHVWVLWWFDRNNTPDKRSILQIHPHPMGNKKNPLTGVFACRAPVRPNPIALTLCRVLSVKDNLVEIDKIDAFADTPILDLKPYIPGYDSAKASVPYWLKNSDQFIERNAVKRDE